MASETQVRARPSQPSEAGPPDDTEESILGTDMHQTTITNVRLGINEAARRHTPRGEAAPWRALSQMELLGCQRANGSDYRTYPDVFVYPRPVDPRRGSMTLESDGPPALIVEVLSPSTYEADLDVERGKGYSYAHAGVREYLTIDPTGDLLAEGIRAWRLEGGVYRPWEPDARGRWRSGQIAVAIGLEGMLVTVYTREGERQPHEGEYSAELERRADEYSAELERCADDHDVEIARRDAEIARQAAELERLRGLLELGCAGRASGLVYLDRRVLEG